MSELDKNEFTRSSFDRNESSFRVRTDDNGEWRAKPVTVSLAAEVPEVRPERKHTSFRALGFGLVAAQFITSALLVVSLITTNVLHKRLIILITIVLALLALLSGAKLLTKKQVSKPTKVACTIISLACIAGSIVAFRYSNAFNGFLDKITTRKETKQYSVMVMTNSNINKIEELASKSAGFLKTDTKAGNAEQYLQDKVKFESDFYDDLDTMAGVLNGKIVDAIVLESDRIEMFKEEAADSVKDTQIIYTFEIELDADDVEIVEKEVTEEPFVLYISGSDSRNGIKATARSDVNILAVVNPKKAKILLVSIPRDTYVQLHGTTGIKDKLTHAGVYGINMSKTTIEDFLGIKIDYTAKVSFDTVVKVVDELNGIEIDSDTAMDLDVEGNKAKRCKYVVGKQQVDGDCALRFARERKSYKNGDHHRGENQQQVIASIISKLSSSKDYLLRLPNILDIAANSFETSLTRDDISSFIRMQLNNNINWEVESISVDGTGSMQGTYSMGANRPLYVMIANPDSVSAATAKINQYLSD